MSTLSRGRLVFALMGAAAVTLFPLAAFGSIGVGVGTGKIQIDAPLKAGGIYDLPSVVVLNTGDESAQYEMAIEYQKDSPQLWPSREWFSFSPRTFSLEPGKTQIVQTNLTLPTRVKPGDYFGYIEAHPVKSDVPGQASIGIAAATKLYFTVAPANFVQGLYWRLSGLYVRYSPWPAVALTTLCTVLLVRFVGKRFQFNVVKR